jgi:hypothetical protein
MIDAREYKLPMWAQGELASLRRKVLELESENATLRGDTPSKVFAQDRGDSNKVNQLGDHSRVVFKTDTGDICCFIRDGVLDVSCYGQILTHHVASNCFQVFIKTR